MNRAERRRLKNKKAEPVINVKSSDIQQMKKDSTNEAADIAFTLMLGLPMLVLRDNYGFGKVRSERFIDQVIDLYDSFDKGYLTIDDIHKALYEEVGIKITKSN